MGESVRRWLEVRGEVVGQTYDSAGYLQHSHEQRAGPGPEDVVVTFADRPWDLEYPRDLGDLLCILFRRQKPAFVVKILRFTTSLLWEINRERGTSRLRWGYVEAVPRLTEV